MMRSLIVMLVVFALGSSSAFAAKPTTQASVFTSNLNFLVEQQTPGGATQEDESLWVVNRTVCAWDPDDLITVSLDGHLRRGESISISHCLIGDWAQHLLGARVTRGDVTVSMTLSGLRTVSGPVACIIGPDYEHNSPKLSLIPDSNGGVGLQHTVTWTLTNTSHRPQWAASVGEIRLDLVSGRNLYCPSPIIREGFDPVIGWSQ